MRKEREAEFTVQVPVRFTFKAGEFTDCDKLWEMAKKEAEKKVCNGDVDYKDNDVEIIDKYVPKTTEDIKAENKFWAEVLGAKI